MYINPIEYLPNWNQIKQRLISIRQKQNFQKTCNDSIE